MNEFDSTQVKVLFERMHLNFLRFKSEDLHPKSLEPAVVGHAWHHHEAHKVCGIAFIGSGLSLLKG